MSVCRARVRLRAIARSAAVSETRPLRRQKRALGRIGRTIGKSRLGVAAEQLAGIQGDPGGDRSGQRTDAGNPTHPQNQAGEKDTQPADAAAQFATRQAQRVTLHGRVQGARRRPPRCFGRAHRSSTMRPSSMRTRRPHRSASP